MKINTKLSLMEYLGLIDILTNVAFDGNGIYRPDYFFLSAVANFYDQCVEDKKYEIEESGTVSAYEEVYNDDEIMEAFKKEVKNIQNAYKLTFNQAYFHAREICEQKSKNAERALNNFMNYVAESIDNISTMITPENVEAFGKMVEEMNKLGKDPEDVDLTKLN